MRLVQVVPALVLLAPTACGHGATSFPLPRNAIDGDTPPWSGPVPKTSLGGAPFQGWCPMPSNSTKDGRHLSGRNGQACFWFSCVIHPAIRDLTSSRWRRPSVSLISRTTTAPRRNGCTIGCPQCDGFTRGPIPDMTQHPCVDQGNSGPGPSTVKPGTPCAKQPSLDANGQPGCAKGFKATNCDPRTRSVNRGAICGGPDDYYYYSPWRAPGEAPVFDAWSVDCLSSAVAMLLSCDVLTEWIATH